MSMAPTYNNAYLTVYAMDASSANEGFLRQMSPPNAFCEDVGESHPDCAAYLTADILGELEDMNGSVYGCLHRASPTNWA